MRRAVLLLAFGLAVQWLFIGAIALAVDTALPLLLVPVLMLIPFIAAVVAGVSVVGEYSLGRLLLTTGLLGAGFGAIQYFIGSSTIVVAGAPSVLWTVIAFSLLTAGSTAATRTVERLRRLEASQTETSGRIGEP